MSKKVFIYGLADPTTKRIHYVGKSEYPEQRYKCHLADKPHVTSKDNRLWIRRLREKGLAPELVILEQVKRNNWQEAEQRWVTRLRRQGEPLNNRHPGGERKLEGRVFVDSSRLRSLRMDAGMSMAQLGRLANVNANTISNLERGIRGTFPYILARLARVLGDTIEELEYKSKEENSV